MAQIVLGLGTSHSPMLNTGIEWWPEHAKRDYQNQALWGPDGRPHPYDELLAMADPSFAQEAVPEKWRARYDASQRHIASVRQVLAEVSPDVVVVFGDDQEELISDQNTPAFLVYWGDTIVNEAVRYQSQAPPSIRPAAWAYGQEGRKDHPGAPSLGKHLIEHLIDQEFDVARSSTFRPGEGVGHAFGYIYGRVMEGGSIPMLPVMFNTYYPPNQPTPKRCYEVGRRVREAIESWESDSRVAVIASGGLSHFVVDEELDRGVIKAMEEGDAAFLGAVPRNKLNSGNSEIRNWIAAAGALEHLRMHLIDYVPCYRTPAGTGCGMAFAYWQ